MKQEAEDLLLVGDAQVIVETAQERSFHLIPKQWDGVSSSFSGL